MAFKKIAKNLIILTLLIIAVIATGIFFNRNAVNQNQTSEIKVPLEINLLDPQPLPEINWTTTEGNIFSIPKNHFTLINFWASWCAPCVIEFPELIKFAKENPEFNLLFVSNDLHKNDIGKFVSSLPERSRKGLINSENIFMLWDNKGEITRDIFQTYKLPETYILDDRQQIVAKINGVLSQDAYSYLRGL